MYPVTKYDTYVAGLSYDVTNAFMPFAAWEHRICHHQAPAVIMISSRSVFS